MEVLEAEPDQLARLGTFETNEAAIAVAVSKENKGLKALENEWVIALDQVRDPGKQNAPKFAAIMEGTNAHKIQFPQGGILVMGNESNGLSTEVLELCENKLTIPRFGEAESLN
eukprot:gene51878-63435_t